MSSAHTADSRLPWRVVREAEGLFEVWTALDLAPGSRNNYAIAVGIQDEGEAMLLATESVKQAEVIRAALAKAKGGAL